MFLLERLFDALRPYLDPYLAPLWTSLNFWRVVALALVALVVAVVVLLVKQRHRLTAFLRRDEHRQHDRTIFAGADALLTEVGLMDTLQTLAGDRAFTRDELRAMTSFGYYFEETGHHYLDRAIGDATVRLLRSLRNLLGFTGLNFRPWGIQPNERGGRYCMLPTLNPDRDGEGVDAKGRARYEKCADELDELIAAVRESYQDYRKRVKTRLTV